MTDRRRARPSGWSGRGSPSARPADLALWDLGGRVDGAAGALPLRSAQLRLPRPAPRAAAACSRWPAGRSPSARPTWRPCHERGLPAARGRPLLRRRGRRAAGPAIGEVVFTTAHDRLPGGAHRPLVRRPDPDLHGADDRQLRRRAATSASPTACRPRRWSAARRATPRRPAATGLLDWLAASGVPCDRGIDTRALVRHLRERGAMRGAVVTDGTPRGRGRRAHRRAAADGRPGPHRGRLAAASRARPRSAPSAAA